nr:MAG TPA: hypothetical protein [Caudoviricetes sp.]
MIRSYTVSIPHLLLRILSKIFHKFNRNIRNRKKMLN